MNRRDFLKLSGLVSIAGLVQFNPLGKLAVTLIDKDNKSVRFELKSKQDAALDIVRHLAQMFKS